MVLALDVHYKETGTAKAVGILFDWTAIQPKKVITEYVNMISDYIPGEFYKRELPCLLKIIEKAPLKDIEAILVDGHIYVDNDGKYGLGGMLWEALNKQTPIIGLAKTSFFSNKQTVNELYRGKSKKPLFLSVIGCDMEATAEKIKNMKGGYRIPTILKELDIITKTE